MSRRELAAHASFEQISPEAGELDEAAFDEAMSADPDATLALLADLSGATDPALRAKARRLAGQLFLDLARQGRAPRRAVGRLRVAPDAGDGGDVDLDANQDSLVLAKHGGTGEPLAVRTWFRADLALCLIVDRSGSMGGAPLAAAAIAAAAMAARAPADYSVVAFSNEVLILTTQHGVRPVDAVVGDLLSLRGFGTTDLAAALQAASEQLATSRAARRVAVLLSDCRANVHGDAVAAAAALDELVILAPASDDVEATTFAGQTGARFAPIDGPSAVPHALATVLA